MTQGPAFEEMGRRFHAARLLTGLTQEEVSHDAGYHRVYMSRIEAGKSNVTVRALLRFSRALGVDPAVLLAGLHEFPDG
jgi:transcriptional regulator with XRE-family HTH domain